MKNILYLFYGVLISTSVFSQNDIKTQNEDFIYWQPNVIIKFEDYQGKPDSNNLNICKKYDYHTITNVNIHSVIDIPAKKRDRGKHLEKVYFAPVFCKKCSFVISQNLTELAQDQIYFNIAELCARRARLQLDSIQAKMGKIYGTLSIMYSTIKKDMEERMWRMFGAYGTDILKNKRVGAYKEWRQKLDEELKQTEKYATQAVECSRFIVNKPLVQGYIMPKNIIGDLGKR